MFLIGFLGSQSLVGPVKLVASWRIPCKLAQSAHKVQIHVFGLSRDLRIKQRAAPGGRSAKDAIAGKSNS